MISTTVTATESTSEPKQPNRLLKKKNIEAAVPVHDQGIRAVRAVCDGAGSARKPP